MSEPRLGRGYGSFLGAALSLLPFKAIVNDILGRIHAGTLDLAASPQAAVGSKGGDKITRDEGEAAILRRLLLGADQLLERSQL